MQTPKTLKGRSARYAEFYDAADEAELGGGDSDDDRDYRDNAEDSAKDVIRRLSLDDAKRDRGHYLEVRSHASLDKIAEFEGKRYRSDDSLQWLKVFIYEMKGTRMPQDSWCEPFSLCLGRAAKSWYRQLPKRPSGGGTCSVRRSSITTAHSLTSRPALDITQLGEKRTSQYAISSSGSMDKPGQRRYNTGRVAQTDGRDRRVTVAVTSDDEEGNEVECQQSRRLDQLDYDDDDSDYGRDGYLDSEEESDHDYTDAGLPDEKCRSGNAREDSGRTQRNSARHQPNSASHWNSVNPPPDRHEEKSDGDGSDMDGIDGELGYSEGESPAMMSNADTTRLETGATGRTKTMRLLPGERLGWWSAQKFDRRVRMRALVMGAVNYQRTKILLDTGANILAINEVFARKLRLKRQASRDVQIGVQGIGKDKVGTSTRAWVKVTLGWEVSYEFEVWVMDHHAGVDLILRTDFMIPTGIRLDLYNSLAKLPDEVVVPLIKSQNLADDPRGGLQVTDGPTETICLPGRLTAEFRIRRRQPAESTHELWVRRTKDWIPTVVLNRSGRATRVLLTSVKTSLTWCPAHVPVLNWTPHGVLPPEGFVRLSSAKYRDWQVLAYEAAMDKDLLRKEQQLYDEWLERQPPAVEKQPYFPPPQRSRGGHPTRRNKQKTRDHPFGVLRVIRPRLRRLRNSYRMRLTPVEWIETRRTRRNLLLS
ncbi:unnamed protein product [Phytophthora fragariaefolia]|uniref:Unnamed protein product n=1 Tax=Phytophthora fragariaefolia TaxID=1490495 RepID=A0A9W6Y8F0_9STRA|nr:unnamed protein product [Phytophthora fragariaefolia]